MLLLLLLPLHAHAADLETWIGGGVHATSGYTFNGGGFSNLDQAEVDGRLAYGPIYARVDFDVHVDPLDPGVVVQPFPPEVAFVQIGREKYQLRLGVNVPAMGLEGWDEWDNYLPTYSTVFNNVACGRVLGAVGEMGVGDSSTVFLFGGSDLDYGWPVMTPIVGGGVTSDNDAWSTYSGVMIYPTEGYYAAQLEGEIYPADALSVALDGGVGLFQGAPFAGGQLVVNILPDGMVTPVVRGEYMWDPDGAALGGAAYGVPDATASVGVRVAPLDVLRFELEGKATFIGGTTVPGVFLGITLHRPEPDEVAYEEEE